MGVAAPIITAVASVAAAGASVYGGIQQNRAQQEQAEAAERNEELAREQAEEQAALRVDEANRDVSRQRASLASRGILASSTAAALRRYTQRFGREDAQAIRRSGEIEAGNFASQASAARASGRSAMASGIGSAASTGASGLANYWRMTR